MKSVPYLLFSLLSACLLLAGCATPPRADGISVTIVGFRQDETSSVQTHAIMTLKFTSDNVNAVGLTSTTHEVYFAKHFVGRAENPSAIGLPPMGTFVQDVAFNLEDATIVRQILSVASQAPYRLDTTLHYTDGDSKRRLKVSSEGKVDLVGLEHAAR